MTVLCFIAASIISGCDAAEPLSTVKITGTLQIGNPELVAAVEEYYKAEAEGNWSITYRLRAKSFREMASFKEYVQAMSEQAQGWHMARVEIIKATFTEPNKAILNIEFLDIITEKATAEEQGFFWSAYTPKFLFRRLNVFHTGPTWWIREDGSWVALDAGMRSHMYWNHEMGSLEPQT